VRRIIEESYEKAKSLLTTNVDLLHRVAEQLLEREALDGADIDEIVRTHRQSAGAAPLTAAGAD
jgi:cell division protease FtsH